MHYLTYPDLDSMKTPGGILAVLCSVAAVTAKPGVDQQIAQLESSNSKLLQYPTQFTQSIMPKAIHSHNDCEHARRPSAPCLTFILFACDDRLEGRAPPDCAQLWGRERRGGRLPHQRDALRESLSGAAVNLRRSSDV